MTQGLSRKVARILLWRLFKKELPVTKRFDCGVTSLVCHLHVQTFVVGLSSLFIELGYRLPVTVFDDGTLTDSDIKFIRFFIKDIEVVSQECAVKRMKRKFADSSSFLAYRLSDNNMPTKKKFDAYFLNIYEKYIYIDADLSFYSKPTEIHDWINTDTKDVLYMQHAREYLGGDKREDLDYSIRLLLKELYYPQIDPSFNSGILCVPSKELLSLSVLNKYFSNITKYWYHRAFCAEEMGMSLLCSRLSSIKFDSRKYVITARNSELDRVRDEDVTLVHYSNETEHRLVGEYLRRKVPMVFDLLW